MSEPDMRSSRSRSSSPEPEPTEPKDARPWDPDEDPAGNSAAGGDPAASKRKKNWLGEWPIGLGG